MSRMARALAVLTVASVLVAVSAVSVASKDCGTALPGSFNLDTCYSGSVGKTTSTFGVTITQATLKSAMTQHSDGVELEIVVWSQKRSSQGWESPSSWFKVQEPHADRSDPVTFSHFSTRLTGYESGTTTAMTATMIYTASSLCVGEYIVTVDRSTSTDSVTADFYLLARLVPKSSTPLSVARGASVDVTTQLLPSQSVPVYFVDSWTGYYPYTVQGLAWSFTPAVSALLTDNSVTWSTFPSFSNGVSASSNTGHNIDVKSTAVMYNITGGVDAPRSRGTPSATAVSLVAPRNNGGVSYPTSFDWTTVGPFIDFTVTYTGVTEWPDVTASHTVTLSTDNGNNYAVFRVPNLPQNWLSITLAFTNVQDVSLPASPVPNVDPEAAWGAASRVSDPLNSGYYQPGDAAATQADSPNVLWNTAFRDTQSERSQSNAYLAPVPLAHSLAPYFVYIQLSPTCNGATVQFTVQATVATLQGECQSYIDCAHGAGNSKYSANGDASRLRHCSLVDTVNAQGTLDTKTRCLECVPGVESKNCQCGPHQYCMTLDGLCTMNGGWWACDPWANHRYGMCVDKDLGGVIGSTCRTTQALEASANNQPSMVGTASNTLSLAVAADAHVHSTANPPGGYGFCGEARFYNATGTTASIPQSINVNGLAHAVLWTGVCVNQRCIECQPTELPVSPVPGYSKCGRVCLNGKVVDPLYVDNTPRTFHHNTVAGTTLAVVMMVILLQLCVCTGAYFTYTLGLPPGAPTPVSQLYALGYYACAPCRPTFKRLCCAACCAPPRHGTSAASRRTKFGYTSFASPRGGRTASRRGTTPLLGGGGGSSAAGGGQPPARRPAPPAPAGAARALSSEMVASPRTRRDLEQRAQDNPLTASTSPVVGRR